ncbi:hypothetical protein BH24CHL9_BH24CHL9_10960 [soil metagenome]
MSRLKGHRSGPVRSVTTRGSASLMLALGLVVLLGGTAVAAPTGSTLASAEQITQRPFRGIVLVGVGSRAACTGFVIAPRKVVTAAHCLTRDAQGGDYRLQKGLPGSLRLYRGYSQAAGGLAYPTCGASRAWAHSRFIRSGSGDRRYGSQAHDYAVLTTAAGCRYPPQAFVRMWSTTLSGGQLPSGTAIAMAGYPSDGRFRDMNGLNLWRTRGKVSSGFGDGARLYVTGFVGQGMSGGPIWRSFRSGSPCGRRHCVVGILTECAVNSSRQCKLGDSIRRGVRLTPAVRQKIKSR